MDIGSYLFQRYVSFVLKWEGGKSNDPNDGAAGCAPFPGAYHTNKGVTYCAFRSLASLFGIPVTYGSFLVLTDQQAAQFIYHYYKSIAGDQLPDSVGLAMTEAAWGSGQSRAVKHLQEAINSLGGALTVDGIIGPKTIAAARAVDPGALYNAYWKQRIDYINSLITQPAYAMYADGWFNRINDFIRSFSTGTKIGVTVGAIALFF